MRYLLIATALLLLLAVVPTDAAAAGPSQGIQIVNNNYVNNNNYNGGSNGYRGRNYDRGYQSYRGYSSRSRGFETHSEAVARIRAAHSRYRTNYHPRSYYNSPPYYERRGW